MGATDRDRELLRELLYGVRSHVHLLDGLAGLEPGVAGARTAGGEHTIFQILHHMIYWQDIALARIHGNAPPDPRTAAEGWALAVAPEDESDWQASVASLAEGVRGLETAVVDPGRELDAPLPGAPRRTVRGEVLMVQGHNSYHLGQIVELRRQLGAWPPPSGGNTW